MISAQPQPLKAWALLAVMAAFPGVLPAAPSAGNATIPGELIADKPSLYCAAFRWLIQGDANLNCAAKMAFREKGAQAWQDAYPPIRVIFPPAGTKLDGKVRRWWKDRPYPNLVAGSIFNLKPATTYDVKISIEDPDGGKAERTVTITTRDWPRDPARTTELRISPATLKGARLDGLAPGTRLVLEAGEYGPLRIGGKGTAEAPIIIEGASDKAARINGSLEFRGSHCWIRNLGVKTGQGPGIRPIETDSPIISGCDVTVSEGGSYGIYLDKCPGGLVFDNTVRGPCVWPRSEGIENEHGIQFSGDDIVVMHNRVAGFGDGISVVNYVEHNNFEACYNDVSECTDDGIQVEFCTQNARVYRNRWTNIYNVLSAAPTWGGPAYLVQNEMYNCHWPYKIMRAASGVLVFNNSSYAWRDGFYSARAERWFNVKMRNNLILGCERKAFECTVGKYFVDVDYNGLGVVNMNNSFSAWGKWDGKNYPSLAAMQEAGLFRNSVVAAPDVWVNIPPLRPEPGVLKSDPASIDFSLKPGATVIDKGEPIANVIGSWTGKAPDLGAREFGAGAPAFGPRTAAQK